MQAEARTNLAAIFVAEVPHTYENKSSMEIHRILDLPHRGQGQTDTPTGPV